MGKVFREKLVPIPSGSKVYSGKRVFDPPKGPIREILIGYAVSETMMIPNESYFKRHKSEWLAIEPDGYYMVCPSTLRIGLYALVLGAAQKLGMYADLIKIYGRNDANMIMDYIMYLISERENATYLMQAALKGEVTFSGAPYDDTTYSNFFNEDYHQNYSRAVLDLWLKRCIDNGLKSVYLAIDGSNNDCDAKENDLAEPGEAKSKRDGPIVGFIWAVQANGDRAGIPITYFLGKGGVVDSTSVKEVIAYFKAFNITVEGVICDRGFCDIGTFLLMLDSGLPYIIMLKKNTQGFKEMLIQYESKIRTFSNFVGNGLYGISGTAQIFKDNQFSSNISLFFNPATRGFAEKDLLNNIFNAKLEIENNIQRGVRAAVPAGLKRYLHIDGKGKNRSVLLDEDAIEAELKRLGFFAIATQENLSPSETIKIYNYRMVIEKAFSYLKSQLGSDVFRVYTEGSARAKFFVAFIGSLIRYDIQQTCKSLKLKTNLMIKEMVDFHYDLFNKAYLYIDDAKVPHKNLLSKYGITSKVFYDFEPEMTIRYVRILDDDERRKRNYNALPWVEPQSAHEVDNCGNDYSGETEDPKSNNKSEVTEESNTSGGPPPGQTSKPKHPGGRPKGSKNKSTLAREAAERAERERRMELGLPEPERPKAGRPRGAKDSYKRTRSTKAQMAAKHTAQSP